MFRTWGGGLLALSLFALGGCAPSYGPLTRDARAAFDAGSWDRAALGSAKILRDPAATERERDLAEQRLAVSLQRLGLRVAGASLLKAIAAQPGHAARDEALRSLLPIALDLPLSAGIEAPLLRYDPGALDAVLRDLPSPVVSRIRYLLGYFELTNGNLRGALAHLEKVKDGDFAKAHLLIAICHVKNRKSVPAVDALKRVVQSVPSPSSDPEARRLVDLAILLKARVFYSVSPRVDAVRQVVIVDREKANTALHEWKKIDVDGPFGLDALWERAWVELALGDQKGALADLRKAIATPGAHVPEAEELEASVRWGMGEKDAALESLRGFVEKYSKVRAALEELTTALSKAADPTAAALALLSQAKDRPAEIPAPVRAVVTHALRDRRVLENLELAWIIEGEQKRFEALPEELRSAAGDRVTKALGDERRALLGRSAKMVRERLKDEADTLATLVAEAEAVLGPK